MIQNDTFICSKGLIFPFVVEREWSVPLRACLYLIALLYSFVGMAIIAEVFMCAIERITSMTRKVPIVKAGQHTNKPIEYKEVLIWNPTVANVSLMALGTSAPEILISIIEVLGHNFKAGELGPGTIVGSAAFNLMVITAICIASVPNGEKKTISNISVYCVTAFWNVFAYLWLLFILMGPSKDEVEVWEGAFTLIFFFVLIVSAYITDTKLYQEWFKRLLNKSHNSNFQHLESVRSISSNIDNAIMIDVLEPNGSSSNPEWHQIERDTSLEFPNLCDEELAKVVALKINAQRPKDYLEHRIDAIRTLSRTSSLDFEDLVETGILGKDKSSKDLKIEFGARVYGIESENQTKVILKVIRRGSNEKPISFKYETVNGVAKSDVHFVSKSEILTFDSGENEKLITISLVQNAKWMKDDVFIVILNPDPSTPKDRTKIGNCNTAEVFFVGNEDKETKSEIEFVSYCVNFKFRKGCVRMPVVRKGNLKRKISTDWILEGINADGGSVSNVTTGRVDFEEGEIETYFDIPIAENTSIEDTKIFLVRLINPSTNVIIGQRSISVINNEGYKRLFSRVDVMIPRLLRSLRPWNQSWKEQFYQHMYVNGGRNKSATVIDYVLHVVAFPYKVVCTIVPPATYLGGWLTFIIALILISIVTTLCLDFASGFGCLMGLDNTITAITFVAVGSSLPDTFASRIAAIKDKTADNAVGNVTGSNSVNVFIGLGFPWFVASIYWAVQGKSFHVPSGDIAFCVTIYCICSIATIALLFARRYFDFFGKAELGGPWGIKWSCTIVLIFIWFLYVLLSSLQVYGHINAHF